MPINVYTGLMRSGKSYEVVSEVILNAIVAGRRVVTNVDGISNDLIRRYVADQNRLELESLGAIVHVTNADVFSENFLPYFDDEKNAHTGTIVQPGDLVCIDEAWRFWGTDCKLKKEHKSFFLEHGHFTHPETGVACDLVLMIQDMGTLHRFVKNVVAFNFRTHKKISLGMGNTYSITCWEGYKQTKQTRIGEWIRKYNKAIFPLYSSFKGGAQGKTVNVDKRQNIFSGGKLWLLLLALLVVGSLSLYKVYRFFKPSVEVDVTPATRDRSTNHAVKSIENKSEKVSFSSTWKASGSLYVNGQAYILVTNSDGAVRFESPSQFQNTGITQIGQIDGERVSSWSGPSIVGKGTFSPSMPITAPKAQSQTELVK